MGFYQLNLSDTPIPFPTATPMGEGYTQAEIASFLKHTVKSGDTLSQIAATYNVSVDDIIQINNLPDTNIFVGQMLVIPGVQGPTRLNGEHGTVMVNIFAKPDGRQRASYTFISEKDQASYQLVGDALEPLQQLNGRPIAVWGSITYDQYGQPSLTVEKFEALYPDLQFQVLSGTQENKDVNDESLVLFTSGGTTYVQVSNTGGYPDGNYFPGAGEIYIEGLQVPNETYSGYPTLRVFNIGPAINPATGEKVEFPHTADTIEVMPDPYGNADEYVNPDAVIEKVELVYFINNPANQPDIPQGDSYIQPAWHFVGRFSNGNILDVLVQALRQEYLSPDLNDNIPPG
jgi:LysM repeat protein